MSARWLAVLSSLLFAALARADGPGDNRPDNVRPIPPPGIKVPEKDRAELGQALEALGKDVEGLRKALASKPALLDLLPDVEVYHKAVHYALRYDEFYDRGELAVARALLEQGRKRAGELRAGQAPWTTATGLVVRGYVSRIDGSVQPYGLVVPGSYRAESPSRHRLDVWCHGRGEKLTELSFIDGRQKSPGEFTPRHAFVLHPYGRYCNANKFAGEVDVLEALAHVEKHYPTDPDRVVMRGFSMGGAACWQFAVHHPGRWAAAAPGAGFSETADFLKVFQDEEVKPAWYERKLWHLYDCTDYAANLSNCPVVAYSGAKDRQKQAADMMAAAMEKEGLTLVHVIGPGAQHFYERGAKEEVSRRIDRLAARGRQAVPRTIRFTTWTLRYNRVGWVVVDGLEQHWERADVRAALHADHVTVQTKNVRALSLSFGPGDCPLGVAGRPLVAIDGRVLRATPVLSDRSWEAHFRKTNGMWEAVKSADDGTLRKRHGLQGPIDDAFMDSFLMVRPTGKALNEEVGAWVKGELAHALDHWRKQFRGDARVKDDADVTEADIAAHNLVLWGDPGSNKVLARIKDKLPIRWDANGVRVGKRDLATSHHVPVLISSSPLNPRRYVVLNSGFTFREYDYLNNARQVPKLPDYAVIDLRTPPSSRTPGAIATAGFFDEGWKLPEGK